jgi:endonuclease YncB( thermonuclease family)
VWISAVIRTRLPGRVSRRAAFTVLAALVAIVLPAASFAGEAAELVGIPSVIDGDTIELHGERIRLFGKIISCSDALVCPGSP